MWLATKLGFYSIVEKSHDEFHVRARWRRDLLNLREAAGIEGVTIHYSSATDYPYRLLVTGKTLQQIFEKAFLPSIDYGNFKSMIATRPDQREKEKPYARVWLTLLDAAESDKGADRER